MKKRIAVLLALALTLSVVPVYASEAVENTVSTVPTEPTETTVTTEPTETIEVTEVTEPAEATAPTEIVEETLPPDALPEAVLPCPDIPKKPLCTQRDSRNPSDTVTIDSETGTYTVVTASGTALSVTVPFGTLCITQDVAAQLDTYLTLFDDVGAALDSYLSQNIHMDIYDIYTGSSTYITECDNPLAALVGQLNTLDRAASRELAHYLSVHCYGSHSAAIKTVGKNVYIAFDLAKDQGFVVYVHIVNGKLIEVYRPCTSWKEGTADVERILTGLTLGKAGEEATAAS